MSSPLSCWPWCGFLLDHWSLCHFDTDTVLSCVILVITVINTGRFLPKRELMHTESGKWIKFYATKVVGFMWSPGICKKARDSAPEGKL